MKVLRASLGCSASTGNLSSCWASACCNSQPTARPMLTNILRNILDCLCTVASLLKSCAGQQTFFREDCMCSVASTFSFFFFLLVGSVHVLCRLPRFNPQMLSNVVWAGATMGFADDTAFIQAAARAAIQLQEQLLAQVGAVCCMGQLSYCICSKSIAGTVDSASQ